MNYKKLIIAFAFLVCIQQYTYSATSSQKIGLYSVLTRNNGNKNYKAKSPIQSIQSNDEEELITLAQYIGYKIVDLYQGSKAPVKSFFNGVTAIGATLSALLFF